MKDLTIRDISILYLYYKAMNGYDPIVDAHEFRDFINYFEEKFLMRIGSDRNVLDNYDFKFSHFYSEPIKILNNPSSITVGYDTVFPFMARSILARCDNPIFQYEVDFFNRVICDFLKGEKKRKIEIPLALRNENLQIGKAISLEFIQAIWDGYYSRGVDNKRWPIQCDDIERYLLDFDLASHIEAKSIRKDILNFYKDVSFKIASLYQKDGQIQICDDVDQFLAYLHYVDLFDKNDVLKKYLKKIDVKVRPNINSFDFGDPFNQDFYSLKLEDEEASRLIKKLDSLF